MIATLIAAAVAFQPPPAGPPSTSPPPASAPNWAFVSLADKLQTEVLVDAAARLAGSPYATIWVRYEFAADNSSKEPRQPSGRPLSRASLMQVDCERQSARPLQTIDYDRNNLSGASAQVSTASAEWTAAGSEPLADMVDMLACRAGEEAVSDIMLHLAS